MQPTPDTRTHDYPHFFRVSLTTGENLAAIDVVLANQQLVHSLGGVASSTRATYTFSL
jgi:hypothetical protein